MFCSQNCTITFIANIIGRNKSTISRELKRNAVDSKYSAVAAQAAYEQRQRNCHPKKKLADLVVFGKVREKFLEHQWFPEQISQRLKLEKANFSISYSTIYRGIYAGMFDTKKERDSTGNRGAMRISGIEVKLVTPKITLKNEVKLLLATIYPSTLMRLRNAAVLATGKSILLQGKRTVLALLLLQTAKADFFSARNLTRKHLRLSAMLSWNV